MCPRDAHFKEVDMDLLFRSHLGRSPPELVLPNSSKSSELENASSQAVVENSK
jgi:hypothetical protein